MYNIIKRPILASIFFAIIILFGTYSFKNMPIELVPNPDEGLPQLVVSYRWQGASPETLLRKVLLPAEEQITQIKGVEKITSECQQSEGNIRVEFSRNTRMNFANVQLAERLNRLQRELPPQVFGPYIQEQIPNDFQQRPLFRIGIYGQNYSIFTLRKIAEKEVLPHLKAIPGVKSVEMFGGVDPEIKIKTNLDRLEKFNVNIQTILQSLNLNFYTRHSISFTQNNGEITMTLSKNPNSIEEIQDVIIQSWGEKKVYLKDVAEVFLGYQELQFERRFQGQSYVQFEIRKEANYSHLSVAENVREKLRYLANRMHGRVEFVIQSDDSKSLKTQLIKLSKLSFLILIIIFFILLIIVRDMKASLLIFSSVFFSVFATFTIIYLFKIPLNLLTLSGLALGFGMFVDNSVVVFDSILRFRERGYDPYTAASEGARVVIMPVMASTLTTIIVFFSFALLFEDRLRMFYLPLAYIITAALISSIVVSYVLIPSLSCRIKLKIHKKKKNGEDELFTKGRFYPFILKYPLIIIVPIILMSIWSYKTFREEVSFGSFFAWYNDERVVVWLGFRSGTEFKEIQKSIDSFEKIALEKPYNKEINTVIYPRGAYMEISFPPEIESTALPVQLKQELVGMATNLAGVGVRVSGFDQEPYIYNPDTGSHLPYSIMISGYNFEKLMAFSTELKRNILNNKRIKDAEIQTDLRFYWGARDKLFTFKLNRSKMKNYNIPPTYLLYLIGTVVRESSSTQRLKFDDRELFVELKAADVENLELDDILNKEFVVPGTNKPFRLKDVVDIEFNVQKGGITRENQEYKAMIQWDYLGSAKAGDRFHKTIYNNLQVPPGFKKSLEEQRFAITEEEQRQLWWAIGLSAALILLILGMLYENFLQPLLIMVAIPLALIGVFLAYIIMEYAFDSTGWIGIILLSGIVVNNAILLIDNINRHLKDTNKIVHAIAVGTKERIRPIFMTTMTTILGMLPMVIFRDANSQSDIWSSLALCTVGGLTSSTILLLFVLPIMYYEVYKFQKYLTTASFKTFWSPKKAKLDS